MKNNIINYYFSQNNFNTGYNFSGLICDLTGFVKKSIPYLIINSIFFSFYIDRRSVNIKLH